MKHYQNIVELIKDLQSLKWHGSLLTHHMIWKDKPHEAHFLYLDSDDELEDIFDHKTLQPKLAFEANVTHFLDIEIFKGILKNQVDQKSNSSIEDYITALNYYRQYDTFIVMKQT